MITGLLTVIVKIAWQTVEEHKRIANWHASRRGIVQNPSEVRRGMYWFLDQGPHYSSFSAAYRAQRPFAHGTADALFFVSRMSILQLLFLVFHSQPPVRSLLAAASMLLPEACRARTTADLSNPKPCDRRRGGRPDDFSFLGPIFNTYMFYSGKTFDTYHQGTDCVFRRGAHEWLP